MIRASIDIGTNSTRLLIAQKQKNSLVPLYAEEKITQLGLGLDENHNLSCEAMERVLAALRLYKETCAHWKVNTIQVVATSATRDARNKKVFLAKITELGLDCQVISGEQEADLSFFGAISDLPESESVLVCDIGGGSTELVTGSSKEIKTKMSINVGSSRLTRQFFHHDPVTGDEIKRCSSYVRKQLEIPFKPPDVVVFVGGSATTCAMMIHRIALNDASGVHHKKICRDELCYLLQLLTVQTIEQRKHSWVGLPPKRADVILAGAIILQIMLEELGDTFSIVSIRDLLYGILL